MSGNGTALHPSARGCPKWSAEGRNPQERSARGARMKRTGAREEEEQVSGVRFPLCVRKRTLLKLVTVFLHSDT